MSTEIRSTSDYSTFKHVKANRKVDETAVKKLMKSIQQKNLLALNPILVNSKMEVIDGQHRLEAAKRMKYDVFYIKTDYINKEDISRLNRDKKNWTISDYINFYHKEEVKGFAELVGFIEKHPTVNVTVILILVAGGFDRAKMRNGAIKDGIINVDFIEYADEVLEKVYQFYNYFNFALTRHFIVAIARLQRFDKYDHKQMMRRLEKQPRSLVRCVSVKQYIELLEEIYNFGSHIKVTFPRD